MTKLLFISLLFLTSCSRLSTPQPMYFSPVKVDSGFYKGCYGILLDREEVNDKMIYTVEMLCRVQNTEVKTKGKLSKSEFSVMGDE